MPKTKIKGHRIDEGQIKDNHLDKDLVFKEGERLVLNYPTHSNSNDLTKNEKAILTNGGLADTLHTHVGGGGGENGIYTNKERDLQILKLNMKLNSSIYALDNASKEVFDDDDSVDYTQPNFDFDLKEDVISNNNLNTEKQFNNYYLRYKMGYGFTDFKNKYIECNKNNKINIYLNKACEKNYGVEIYKIINSPFINSLLNNNKNLFNNKEFKNIKSKDNLIKIRKFIEYRNPQYYWDDNRTCDLVNYNNKYIVGNVFKYNKSTGGHYSDPNQTFFNRFLTINNNFSGKFKINICAYARSTDDFNNENVSSSNFLGVQEVKNLENIIVYAYNTNNKTYERIAPNGDGEYVIQDKNCISIDLSSFDYFDFLDNNKNDCRYESSYIYLKDYGGKKLDREYIVSCFSPILEITENKNNVQKFSMTICYSNTRHYNNSLLNIINKFDLKSFILPKEIKDFNSLITCGKSESDFYTKALINKEPTVISLVDSNYNKNFCGTYIYTDKVKFDVSKNPETSWASYSPEYVGTEIKNITQINAIMIDNDYIIRNVGELKDINYLKLKLRIPKRIGSNINIYEPIALINKYYRSGWNTIPYISSSSNMQNGDVIQNNNRTRPIYLDNSYADENSNYIELGEIDVIFVKDSVIGVDISFETDNYKNLCFLSDNNVNNYCKTNNMSAYTNPCITDYNYYKYRNLYYYKTISLTSNKLLIEYDLYYYNHCSSVIDLNNYKDNDYISNNKLIRNYDDTNIFNKVFITQIPWRNNFGTTSNFSYKILPSDININKIYFSRDKILNKKVNYLTSNQYYDKDLTLKKDVKYTTDSFTDNNYYFAFKEDYGFCCTINVNIITPFINVSSIAYKFDDIINRFKLCFNCNTIVGNGVNTYDFTDNDNFMPSYIEFYYFTKDNKDIIDAIDNNKLDSTILVPHKLNKLMIKSCEFVANDSRSTLYNNSSNEYFTLSNNSIEFKKFFNSEIFYNINTDLCKDVVGIVMIDQMIDNVNSNPPKLILKKYFTKDDDTAWLDASNGYYTYTAKRAGYCSVSQSLEGYSCCYDSEESNDYNKPINRKEIIFKSNETVKDNLIITDDNMERKEIIFNEYEESTYGSLNVKYNNSLDLMELKNNNLSGTLLFKTMNLKTYKRMLLTYQSTGDLEINISNDNQKNWIKINQDDLFEFKDVSETLDIRVDMKPNAKLYSIGFLYSL